ncbi:MULTISPECIES: amino acid ABC transporter permease [Sporolactobacillus]|uniref:Amino acid ABC transporter permease n=3 Tax=Sporolactobacillus TaxID=2077 RepID=A0A0U1QLC2_9BACL|nr:MULTISPECIES: amino acid ABC transporter permease [Sporolactobacillus]KLI01604.1 amino acid ABC transporter permease [Sporolactobacillus inulinus CASD]QAA21393.1 glutamine ABC transporter permease GlnP [Sporolactobacillus terrae]QAA24365.1 glutamine ABC transporter permease GlnP [Sporolactobacillus terrae]UAK16186.1 amino acid ABC transporter permease [Sporolactobacillus terrae]GEB77062.1 amino acid ABC transporter permease [Sporolactobacillus inulinus]
MENIKLIINFLGQLLPAINITLIVSVSSIILGSLLGLLLAAARLSESVVLRVLASVYVSVVRATPAIIMIFVVYYGMPMLFNDWFHTNIDGWNRMYFVIIALTVLFSAPVSEIMRSAYESIAKGQMEAGLMVGMTPFQTLYRIILPQAFVVALPNFANSVINLLKEGALTFTIGVVDMVAKAQMIVANNSGGYAWQTYCALALIYWVISLAIDKGVSQVEKSYQAKRKTIAV